MPRSFGPGHRPFFADRGLQEEVDTEWTNTSDVVARGDSLEVPRDDTTPSRPESENDLGRLRQRFTEAPQRYVWILMAVTLVDASDRQLIAVVFEDIQRDFGIGDAQLGLLTSAYGVLAVLSFVPFGFLADRMSRVKLIALGFIPWSLAQFGSGMAGSFGMLFLARMFLGTVEASNGPSTPSLLGDYYRVERRTRVFGIYSMGQIGGAVAGLLFGGIVASAIGWRGAFVVWGMAGLVTGAMAFLFLREPVRGLADAFHRAEQQLAESAAAGPSTSAALVEVPPPTVGDYRALGARQAIMTVLRVRTLWVVFAGTALTMFFSSALGVWVPTFYRRYHEMSAASAGGMVAIAAVCSVIGTVLGSRTLDRFVPSAAPQRRLVVIGAAMGLSGVLFVVAFSLDSTAASVAVLAAASFTNAFPAAVLQASMLDVVVPHLRGRASAVQAVLRVGSTAAAPLLFGIISDAQGLRTAWLGTAPLLVLGSVVVAFGSRTYGGDARNAREEAVRQAHLEMLEEEAGSDPGNRLRSTDALTAHIDDDVPFITADVAVMVDPAGPLPIVGYDGLTVRELLPLLPRLYVDELPAVLAHEHASKARRTVLARLGQLQALTGDAPGDVIIEEWLRGGTRT